MASVCPLCHNRGLLPGPDGSQVFCDCPAAQALRDTDRVRARLQGAMSRRDAENWLTSRILDLGSAVPVRLLREGKVSEVMAVVDRIPGIPPDGAEEVGVVRGLPDAAWTEEDVRTRLVRRLREEGHPHVATAALEDRVEGLEDRDRAVVDAALTGTGFLVDGKRVEPERVEVIRWRRV